MSEYPERVTLSGRTAETPDDPRAPAPVDPATGMNKDYWILSEAERAKGFVRPVRRSYVHTDGCGAHTTMGLALCETYARNPFFYSATYCVGCRTHHPVEQFRWDEDGEVVGS